MRVCAGLGGLVLLGSYLGALHPLGDSLAVFRNWIAGLLLACAVVMILVRPRGFGMLVSIGAGIALLGATPIPPAALHASAFVRPQTIYQKNLLFALPNAGAILADIAEIDPDHITLQELNANNRQQVLSALPSHYARHYCGYSSVGGVAVLSRHEVVEGSEFCVQGHGMAGFQVLTPQGPLWVISVHLRWPFPYEQRAQVEELVPVIAALEGPILIGGDFNMVPWSWVLREFAQASGSQVPRPISGTIHLFDGWLAPPIDHVLLPGVGGLHSVRPRLGSDHMGVVGMFEIAP
ncbi:endonuclease/exonuclease/phosphatase family protein [Rhodobacteraceae bacterium N5(2021)]|uniref:Endonuclease/exonuclease/phosphatase family protein n=1 Tax=Gymnodinialimonas phycosphaerae TaxID=2841589 RepID=A0A975TW88_9RHOB|nr:endonuclease/exonuclease/phosphatase family protein [Gymnodinialimonas phycosphaerae]MBY4891574.1 endonuclease/exonuclease/phosphatase family protein [Gymnodinialimonas phycosphaerae]